MADAGIKLSRIGVLVWQGHPPHVLILQAVERNMVLTNGDLSSSNQIIRIVSYSDSVIMSS